MSYPERAVKSCVGSMKLGMISLRHVKNVLNCRSVDVSAIEQFLDDKNDFIRKYAVEIIGQKGNASLLVDMALKEKDKQVLSAIMTQLSRSKEALEGVVVLLDSEDSYIKSSAIDMFRRANRSDCLFPLLFGDDEELIERIKKYIEEDDGRN
jgi:hypothetical protein